MTEQTTTRKLPSLPGLIAGALVVLGVLLWMFVSKGFLFVAGLGAFGLGILRELGWLRDQDEFQRQAAHRAGYHAYLIGGLVTVLVIFALEWRETNLEDSSAWILLILVVLWMTWLFSALLAYWGAQKTTSRVLITFGSFWAVFVIASFIGEDAPSNPVEILLGSLMGLLVVSPFFGLAWTAGRWPRATGTALLAVSALFFVLVSVPAGSRALALSSLLLTATLLIIPLIACGIALLRDAPEPDEGVAPADVSG
ncbi:MAG: hypothetical protein ACE5G0_19615 [Rhodothermales bacterium]